MRKSELIENLIDRFENIPVKNVEQSVKAIIDHMADALAAGDRIEIRGFGSFCLHYRAPRVGVSDYFGCISQLHLHVFWYSYDNRTGSS